MGGEESSITFPFSRWLFGLDSSLLDTAFYKEALIWKGECWNYIQYVIQPKTRAKAEAYTASTKNMLILLMKICFADCDILSIFQDFMK